MNYFELVMDTYQSVKLLNTLDLGLLDDSLAFFRSNLFSQPDFGRKVTTRSIAQLLQQDYADEASDSNVSKLLEAYNGNAVSLANDIFVSLQIVLEFMDKGMKGLLSGDLSSLAIKEIQKIIEKGLPKMEVIQKKIEA